MKLTNIAYGVVLGLVLSANSCVGGHNNIICAHCEKEKGAPCAIPDGLLEEDECGEKQRDAGVVCRKRRKKKYFQCSDCTKMFRINVQMSSNNPVRGACAHLSKQKIELNEGKYVVFHEFL
jgi:hypothetical protein